MAEVASQEIQKYSTLVKLQPENPENHFLLGLAFENAGQVAESVKSYQTCIKLNPKHSLAHLHFGFHLARAGDTDQALVEWSRAFETDANLGTKFATDPHTQREYKQKIDSSIQNFTKPILINPKNAFAHYQLGTAYKFFNLLELSLQSLKRALDINPRLWEAYHTCGEIYSLLQQNKLAINNFKLAVEANPRYADSHYMLAQVYERENQSTLAIKHLEEAIKLDADQARYYFAYGRVLMKQTKYKNAMMHIQKGLNIEKNNAEGFMLLANCCKELYRPDLALVSYERAVESNPNFAEAIYELGTIALQLGETDKAISSFERALELNAEDPYAQYHLASAYQRKGDFHKAEEHYRQAALLGPKDAFAAYNLGLVRQELGNLAGALEAFRKAVDLKPQDATYHLVLAKCAMAQEEHEEAVSHLRDAIKLNPNDQETNFLLADVMMQMGKFDEAISMFRKVTEISPDSTDAHTRLAEAFYKLEMFDYAFESYQQALRLDSKHIPSLHGMGNLYLHYRNKPSIAVDFFQQALELEPSHAPSLASLGEAYIALNQPERALQFFERKLEENRENPDYLSKYAEALALGGKTEKAIEELKRALQLAPENVLMRSTLAKMYLQDKRYADALDQFQRLAQQQPKEAQHFYHLGTIYEQLGETEKAGRAYNDALVRRPDHPEAMERLEVIYEGQDIPRPRASAPMEPVVDSYDPPMEETIAAHIGNEDDPLGNLEALLGVGSLESAQIPLPNYVDAQEPEPEPEPTPAPAVAAPSPPVAAVEPPTPDQSTEDLLSSLMGGSEEAAAAPPPPPMPPAVAAMDTDISDLFGVAEEGGAFRTTASVEEEPIPTPAPVAEDPPAVEPEPEPEPQVEAEPQTEPEPELQSVAEPEPEPQAEIAPVAEVEPEAPSSPVPAATAAEDTGDLSDFLRDLGYADDVDTSTPVVAVPSPAQSEPAGSTAEDILGIQADEAPPAPAASLETASGTSIDELFGLSEDEPPPPVVEPAEPVQEPLLTVAEPETPIAEVASEPIAINEAAAEPAVAEAAPVPPETVPAPEPAAEEAAVQEASTEDADTEEAPAEVPAAQEAVPAPVATFADLGDQLEVVQDFIDLGKLDRARQRLEKLLDSNEGHPLVLQLLGTVSTETGDHAAAARFLEQAVTSAPSDQLFDELTEAYAKVGDEDNRQQALQRWLAFNPNAEKAQPAPALETTPAYLELEAAGDWAGALSTLALLAENEPDRAADLKLERDRIYQTWRDQLEEQGNFSRAVEISREQQQLAPGDPKLEEELLRLYGAWAEHHEAAKEWEQAAQVYRSQMDAGIVNPAAQSNLDRIFTTWAGEVTGAGDYEGSIAVWERATGVPGMEETARERSRGLFVEWSQALRGSGDFASALQVLEQAAQHGESASVQQETAAVYQAWAQHWEQEGDFEQAIDCVKRQSSVAGQTPQLQEQVLQLYRTWAECLREEGLAEAAAEVQARLVAEFPDQAPAPADPWETLQPQLQDMETSSDFGAALGAAQDFLKSNPEHEGARSRLTELQRAYLTQLQTSGNWEAWKDTLGEPGDALRETALAGFRQRGEELLTQENYADAITWANGFESWDAAEAGAVRELAATAWIDHVASSDPAAALAKVEELHGQVPSLSERREPLTMTVALAEAEARQYESALGRLETLSDASTARATIFDSWSKHLEEEGDFEEAINVLGRWVKSAPHDEAPQRRIVTAYQSWAEGLAEGEHQEAAVAVLQQLLASELAVLQDASVREQVEARLQALQPKTAVADAAPAEAEAEAEAAPAETAAGEAAPAETAATEAAPAEAEATPAEAEATPAEAEATPAEAEATPAEAGPTPAEAEAAAVDSQAAPAPQAAPADTEAGATEAEAAPAEAAAGPPSDAVGDAWAEVSQLETAGQWAEAQEAATRAHAATANPAAFVGHLLALSRHWLAEKQVDQALAVINQAKEVENVPASLVQEVSDLAQQARIEMALHGDTEQAEDFLREMMAQDPTNGNFHNALYRLHGQTSMSGRRLVDFYRDLQKSFPNEPAFLLQLARAYCNAGKDTLAVVQFRKLVQIAPQASYYTELACTYVRLKKAPDAQKALGSALELDANYAPALLVAMQIAAQANDLAGARDYATKARPHVVSAQTLAWLDQVQAALDDDKAPEESLLQNLPPAP
jgi:tetratricopeptide (TPR) repeat protein